MASEADGTYTHVLSLHTFPKFKFSYTLAPCVIPDKSNLPPICEDKDSLLVVGRPIYNLPKNVFENVFKFLGILLSSQKKKIFRSYHIWNFVAAEILFSTRLTDLFRQA